jgi:hypothetical protein
MQLRTLVIPLKQQFCPLPVDEQHSQVSFGGRWVLVFVTSDAEPSSSLLDGLGVRLILS